MLDSCKMVEKQSEAFYTFLWHFFLSLKQNFIAYRFSKASSHPDCIFEICQLWQSSFSRVYSNSCCSYPFEAEIIKIGQSTHKIYSNNILSTTILNACTKKSGNLLKAPRIYISKVGEHSRGWPEGSLFDSYYTGEGATPSPGLLHFTLDPYLTMLSVKQGGIKYHFLSLVYDSTWDWTQVSRAIGEHSNRYANVR